MLSVAERASEGSPSATTKAQTLDTSAELIWRLLHLSFYNRQEHLKAITAMRGKQ